MIRKRDSIEDFYWNENLPLGFFIKNGGGDGAGNNGQSATAALFGAGSGQAATSAFGRSSIPKKPQVGFLFKCARVSQNSNEFLLIYVIRQ